LAGEQAQQYWRMSLMGMKPLVARDNVPQLDDETGKLHVVFNQKAKG